jgi:hypothetical protein
MVCRGSNAVVADTLWKHAGSEVPGIGRPYKVERVNLQREQAKRIEAKSPGV